MPRPATSVRWVRFPSSLKTNRAAHANTWATVESEGQAAMPLAARRTAALMPVGVRGNRAGFARGAVAAKCGTADIQNRKPTPAFVIPTGRIREQT